MALFILGIIFGAGLAIFSLSLLSVIERRARDAKSFRTLVEQRKNPTGNPRKAHDLNANTVVMRPAVGFRILSLVMGAAVMWVTWGPYVRSEYFEFFVAMALTLSVFYFVVFVANYEARYDSEGVTAPNWLFRDKRYEWAHLMNTKDNGNLRYKLQFLDHGTLRLQKYLVGMPAYLTFLSDIEATTQEI